MKARTPKPKREYLEMLDGRKFFSEDNWHTIWQYRGHTNGSSHRKVLDKGEADRIRFLVIAQGSAGP
ncbi:hypothetical protein [Mesorhizobium sp. B2-8-3]|uniref:hypothetical protein n=1 Tax=Mesorhizobium sp. B2-8-3 TaxID=2589905 RepID=UPI00112D351B|nr:hypothetical protein [Mesorhizobium sp. B2-8-3]TPJ33702.1 hypothetical protein FJ418_13820 [Mesorhizobium sp. B2-8-3]